MRPERIGIGGFGTRAPRFGNTFGLTFEQALADAFNIEAEGSGLMALDWSQNPKDIEYGGKASSIDKLVSVDGGVRLKMGAALVLTDRRARDRERGATLREGGVMVWRG